MERTTLNVHIDLIKEAMQKAGVWSTETPEWVRHYDKGPVPDFWQWLQFIHLPMRSLGIIPKPDYLAPQMSSFLNGDAGQRKILQLVIELDSITSTLNKPNSSKL